MSSNIEKAQHDILQVPITQTMVDWAKEQAIISTDRSITTYNSGSSELFYDEVLENQFEQTILFALRVGILLGRWSKDAEVPVL